MEKAKLFTRFSARATASGADDLLSKDFLMARAMRQRRKAMEEYMNAVLVACNMRLAVGTVKSVA